MPLRARESGSAQRHGGAASCAPCERRPCTLCTSEAEVRKLIEDAPGHTPRYELVDGELLVTPGPALNHQRIAASPFKRLGPYVDQRRLGELLFRPADIRLAPEFDPPTRSLRAAVRRRRVAPARRGRQPPTARRRDRVTQLRALRSNAKTARPSRSASARVLGRRRRQPRHRAVAPHRHSAGAARSGSALAARRARGRRSVHARHRDDVRRCATDARMTRGTPTDTVVT